MSPTQRTLAWLRERGYVPAVIERHNTFSGKKTDAFGFADILAMREGQRPLLVQTTSGSNLAARRKKVLENELALLALQSGFDIMLQGWTKRKKRVDGRLWYDRTEEILIEDFNEH